MHIFQRYRQLTIWNKLAVWGSVASLLGLVLSIPIRRPRGASPSSPPSISLPTPSAIADVGITSPSTSAIAASPPASSRLLGNSSDPSDSAQPPATAVLTYDGIVHALRHAPPLQLDDVAKHYRGIPVSWSATLSKIDRLEKGLVRLYLATGEGTGTVLCTVPLAKYRHLQVAPKGTPIRVTGVIEEVTTLAVYLRDATLAFPPVPTPGQS